MRRRMRLAIPALLVLGAGFYLIMQSGARTIADWKMSFHQNLGETAEKMFLPGLHYAFKEKEEESWLEEQLMAFLPIQGYTQEKAGQMAEVEDHVTYEMILKLQAEDAERMSEDLAEQEKGNESANEAAAAISIEELKDFNSLLSKFYTVDSTTMVYEEELNAEQMLAKNMKIDISTGEPKVLIFHTHSQETFVDSKEEDVSTSIVGMGAYLAEKLNEKGITAIHHAGVYDLIDGKLDRSKAYELSEIGVQEILNQNPSIEVVIDLHRDGVREDLHLVTEVDGKQTAKIMFFNGLSRTKTNGDISYLQNPYKLDNLAFSFQMQLASEQMYPGLARKIYLKGYRYSLHMLPKSLLIEAGAQTNTVQEMRNAMELLANILERVIV